MVKTGEFIIALSLVCVFEIFHKDRFFRGFPGGPVIKTLCCQYREYGFDPSVLPIQGVWVRSHMPHSQNTKACYRSDIIRNLMKTLKSLHPKKKKNL